MKKIKIIKYCFLLFFVSCDTKNKIESNLNRNKLASIENENYNLYKQRFVILKKLEKGKEIEVISWLRESLLTFTKIPINNLTDEQIELRDKVIEYLSSNN